MPKFKLHIDTNWCGVNEDIYIEADEEPSADDIETYVNDWCGLCWDIEEIEVKDKESELYDFEDW